jgi:hypothetical protein
VTRLNNQAHLHRQKLERQKKEESKAGAKKKDGAGASAAEEGGLTTLGSPDMGLMMMPGQGGEGQGEGEEGGDTEDSRAAQLQTLLAATHQKQVETCLRFRTFATRNYVIRLRLLRCFYGLVRLFKYNHSHRIRVLCGDEEKARIKLKLITARLLLCKLERAGDAWQAEQVTDDRLRQKGPSEV